MEPDMKTSEIEYQKRLAKFSKYRKEGIDLAFRCNGCGNLVFQSDILFGVGCRKCTSRKVCPITADLTWFGLYYCRFWNWIWNLYYENFEFKELKKES